MIGTVLPAYDRWPMRIILTKVWDSYVLTIDWTTYNDCTGCVMERPLDAMLKNRNIVI